MLSSSFLSLLFLFSLLFTLTPSVYSRSHSPIRGRYYDSSEELIRAGLLRQQTFCSTCPQQVFSSLSSSSVETNEMTFVFSWVTTDTHSPPSKGDENIFAWGHSPLQQSETHESHDVISGLPNVIVGTSYDWVSPIPPYEFRRFHLVSLTLPPSTSIFYHVGNNFTGNFSDLLSFRSPPMGNEVMNIIVYGDLGIVNSQSMQYIINNTQSGEVDLVLHLGDFAYDLHSLNGLYGDVFFNEIQPISSTVPYMGQIGNHEGKFNSTHYTNRFISYEGAGKTSHSDTNWWFSWDIISGGSTVHMVAINTEVYYDYVDWQYGAPPNLHSSRQRQYNWLMSDLQTYGKGGSQQADWLIVYGHRPMYCSNTDDIVNGNGDCTSDAEVLRDGWSQYANGNGNDKNKEFPMEEILLSYGVDMYFSAHEHSYERIYPIYKGKLDPIVQRGTNHTYVNPSYPTHIVSGSAGCQEGFDTFDPMFYGFFSVVRSASYGYGRLLVQNKTHLYWEQYLDEGRGGKDYLWIVKE